MNVIKKVFFIALMIWTLWIVSSQATTGKISTEGARIRREPNTTSDVLTIAYQGETVEIIEEQEEWYKVKYGENEGYVRSDLITVEEKEEQPSEEPSTENEEQEPETLEQPEAIETISQEEAKTEENPQEEIGEQHPQEFVEVEKKVRINTVAKVIPSLSASKIGELKQGEKVVVVQEMNRWSCIKIESKTAWVLTSTLEMVEEGENLGQEETPNEPETKIMYISVSAAVLREGPDTQTDAIAEMYRGKTVEILSEEEDWYKVRYGEKEGYVAKRLVTNTIEETHRSLITDRRSTQKSVEELEEISSITEEEPVQEVIKTVYVNVAVANLRAGASTDTAVIKRVSRKEELEVIGEENGWYQIKLEDSTAYLLKTLAVDNVEDVQEPVSTANQVKESSPTTDVSTSIGEEVVAYAKQYLGCAYVYGGSGPSSFDCSGFTQYVYGHFGIQLSHSAVTQANNGTYVEKSNLQLGDLIIFRDWDNSSIGHCGIYIGGGSFIHAANSKRGVVTDTINSGYYYERYVSARRLL